MDWFPSLMTQRFDRAKRGGSAGRVTAEEQADQGGHAERERDRRGRDDGLDADDPELAADHADGDTQQPAEQAQQGRLGEELAEDGGAGGADGLADADLADPLGDRDQHDVGDPDPAYQQRD